MDDHLLRTEKWIKLGMVSGLLVSAVYPAIIFLPLPALIQVCLVITFGPLLALASAGLYFYITLHKNSISAFIAMVSNIIAGTLVTVMLLVQMAIRYSKPSAVSPSIQWIWESINQVHLGLDVAWDGYIFIGTLLFAISMFSHPKLGKIFSITGIIISISMIALNVFSFPVPPANSGLIDMGPFIGLWYLAVTLSILINYSWVRANIDSDS